MSIKFSYKIVKLLYNLNTMSLEEQKQVGEKIRQARAIAGISQINLAKLIGIGKNAMIDSEKGRRPVTITELSKIAKATNQPLSFFFEEEITESTDKNTLDATGLDAEDIEILEKMAERMRHKGKKSTA